MSRSTISYNDLDLSTQEKFTHRREQDRSRQNRRREKLVKKLTTACTRIIHATKRYGHGFIKATTAHDAVQWLVEWVDTYDGELGRGRGLVQTLHSAFMRLHNSDVFLYCPDNGGYRLNVV